MRLLGVGPEFLEAVMAAPILVEDVDHHIGVVEQRPLAASKALLGPGRLVVFLLGELLHAAGDGLHLRVGLGLANHEASCHAVGQGAEIHQADLLSLYFLNALHDARDEYVRGRSFRAFPSFPGRHRVGTRIEVVACLFQRR